MQFRATKQRLLETPSLMTDSEKAIKAIKALQQPINIPNTPNILQEVQPTPQQVRKRPSVLTPPATVDPANIPLPSCSASEDEQSTKKKKYGSPFRTIKKKNRNVENIG